MVFSNEPNEKMYPIDAVVLAGKSKLIVEGNNEFYSPLNLSDSFPYYLFHTKMAIPPEIEDSIPIDYKSILKLNGRPMVNYVMQALAESEIIKDIYLVGEKDKLNKIDFSEGKEKINFVADQGSLLDNFIEGGNKTSTKKILFSTSDIPLIKTKDINNFVQECLIKEDGSIYISYCTKKLNQENLKQRYPAKLQGEYLRNGSVLMIDRVLLNVLNNKGELYGSASRLYGKRKEGLWPYLTGLENYIPIEKVLPLYIANLFLNNLSIKRLEGLISSKATESIKKETGGNTNFNFYGIEVPHEFAEDIDSLADLIKFEEHLKEILI